MAPDARLSAVGRGDTRMSLGGLWAAGLPLVAIVLFATVVGAAVFASSIAETLGFDFLAYHLAAVRVLDGAPVYDLSFDGAGSFGLFYYPPTFVLMVVPFALLPSMVAVWAWTVLLVAAFGLGVAVLPVSRQVKWLVILLAGMSWPFVYAIKLGQVGPLLFLGFALGWRYLERPTVFGIAAALGAAIKIQPGLVLAWALAMRRWSAVFIGGIALVGLIVAATALTGFSAWADYRALLSAVTDPITTPHNMTPGALAYQLGAPAGVAVVIQIGGWVFAAGAILLAVWKTTPVAGFLVTVAASQLVSPILWDHYAMLLLLPVAWLLDRGLRWAVLVPLVTAVPLIEVIPAIVYPSAFVVTILAVLWSGRSVAARP